MLRLEFECMSVLGVEDTDLSGIEKLEVGTEVEGETCDIERTEEA